MQLGQDSSKILSQALTFDDVLLVPAYADFLPDETNLQTRLTAKIQLNVPLLSAAMDTVTTSAMAIAMAHEGGIGIIHKNLSIEQQTQEVDSVKKYESGIISDPITLKPSCTVEQAIQLANVKGISGFPVVDGEQLIGIVTRRDLRYAENSSASIASVMTSKEKLVVIEESKNDKNEWKSLLHQNRIERLLVVNNKKDFKLTGMITVKDINKAANFPLSARDQRGSLLVGAAIGTESDRYQSLIEAGVDILVIDTAHGHSSRVIKQIQKIKQYNSDVSIIAGNIATADAAKMLADNGADAVKVGIGPGSICTTRIIAGVGCPQISAIQSVAQALQGKNIGIIADGGIRFSGDIGKAIASGADCIMMGSILAGTEETPGEIEYYQGRPHKVYRGMGSIPAMSENHGSSDRYLQKNIPTQKLVPEGIEGRVPFKGSVHQVIHQMLGGLKACMGYTGSATIEQLKQAKMFQITNAGMIESHVHDVSITKESPNYHI